MMPSEITLLQSELAKNLDKNKVTLFIDKTHEFALQQMGLKSIPASLDPIIITSLLSRVANAILSPFKKAISFVRGKLKIK
jgi:hypothetical protein